MRKITLASLVFLTSCFTSRPESGFVSPDYPPPKSSYTSVLNKWTDKDRAYTGMTAAFQIEATLMSQDLIEHQLYIDADQFHWTNEQFKEARQKALYDAQSEATVFISFYTEKDENNNLDKTNTDWNIFLDVGGKRVSPKSLKRLYTNRAVLLNKYPYHDAWSRAYEVKFVIPTLSATASEARLIVAGPIGASHLKFPQ